MKAALVVAAILCMASPHADAGTDEVLVGKVVGVHDGDTLTVLTPAKVRLNGIDAPESGQAFGEKSKQALSAMVFGKDVRIVITDTDRYDPAGNIVIVVRTDVGTSGYLIGGRTSPPEVYARQQAKQN